jgi:hypothetical protein
VVDTATCKNRTRNEIRCKTTIGENLSARMSPGEIGAWSNNLLPETLKWGGKNQVGSGLPIDRHVEYVNAHEYREV